MKIIPAIDLKEGKCVRLLQGRKDEVTTYSSDPVSVAKRWVAEGADLIHIVDLDGAFSGNQANIDSIKKIRAAVNVDLELGGGIRDMERIDYLISIGIERVILGTVAVKKPELVREASEKHPGKIIVGIDARDGKAAIKGWVEVTDTDAFELARQMETLGASGIIYTDISRDGMLTGPNLETMKRMVNAVEIPVIASGGISSMEDIRHLASIPGLWGAITGKALYTGNISLEEAIRVAEERG